MTPEQALAFLDHTPQWVLREVFVRDPEMKKRLERILSRRPTAFDGRTPEEIEEIFATSEPIHCPGCDRTDWDACPGFVLR